MLINITVYKINDMFDYENKLKENESDTLKFTFLKHNSKAKKIIMSNDTISNIENNVAIMCETFMDLLTEYTLMDVANILDRGVSLIIKNEPAISQIWFDNFEGEEQLMISSPMQIEIDTIRAIASTQIRKSQGRAAAVFSEEFVKDYWGWQTGNITVKEILESENKSYGFSTKQQFYSLAERYERTNSYLLLQDRYANDIITEKKKGKVDLQKLVSYVKENKNSGLDKNNILELEKLLKVNHIDLWRIVRKLHASKYYKDIENCKFKESLNSVIKLIDDYDKKFFTTKNSEVIDYSKSFAEIIISIEKIK